MADTPVIWFFRESRPDDRYQAAFSAAGFSFRHIPVLRYEYESEWHPLPDVDAVVLTSQRAAESLAASPNLEQRLPPGIRNLPWYVIGQSTLKALEPLGVPTEPPTAHTAVQLARTIRDRGHRRIAFFAGEPHRLDLPKILRKAGVEVEIRIVYRAEPDTTLQLADLETPDWAVFFSPRGVETIAQVKGPDWTSVRIATIGPTTASAVRKHRWNLAAVASDPSAEALLRAIHSMLSLSDSEPTTT